MEYRWSRFLDTGRSHHFIYPNYLPRDLFNRHAEAFPDKPYLIFGDLQLPYSLCNSMARRLANGLLKLGIQKGDRVGLMAPNIPQYVIGLQACFKLGVIAVPTNPLYTAPEIKHQFCDSDAETVIVMAPFADKVISVMKSGESPVKRVIAIQVKSMPVQLEQLPGVFDFDEIMASGEDIEPDIEVSQDDIALLQYTGGTTGVAKACMLTNFNIVAMGYALGDGVNGLVARAKVRAMAAIPVYHIYGFNCNINLCLYGGGTIILVAQPTVDNLLDNINKHEPNIFASVPAMLIGLNNHPDTPTSKIKSIDSVFCGSAPLPADVFKRFEELSGARITEGYGMSETVNIVTSIPFFTRRKIGSIGIPYPDVEIKIMDSETGTQEMPIGEPGELVCKGPQVMKGYWRNPEETANVMRDGWLYTGDIAYMDEDGFLFIVDRKKDMIIVNGFNVFPRDVDEVLFAHPKVLEACTIGVPDGKQGESIKIFVVVKPGETLTEEEIIQHCRQSLAPYKIPKLVEFVAAVPRTSVGKVDRKEIRRMEMEKRNNSAEQ
ncbi:MAG: Long-chain-fatty-acid--CoA ligase [Firmicutes bacterium]|nr:Long-chain-fatty-acid--CoA ligase [Bacillota bacterium]